VALRYALKQSVHNKINCLRYTHVHSEGLKVCAHARKFMFYFILRCTKAANKRKREHRCTKLKQKVHTKFDL